MVSIALSNPGRFQNDKIKCGVFTYIDGILHVFAQGDGRFRVLPVSAYRPADARMEIHSYSITQQGTARLFLERGLPKHDRNGLFGKLIEEPADDLVCNR